LATLYSPGFVSKSSIDGIERRDRSLSDITISINKVKNPVPFNIKTNAIIHLGRPTNRTLPD